MGGYIQAQGHVQNFLNILRGMDPQSSVDTLRFCIAFEGDGTVLIEEGMDEKELEKLRAKGHKIQVVRGHERAVSLTFQALASRLLRGQAHARSFLQVFGRAQIIERRVDARTGKVVYLAGSDPRGDGHAVAW